jgi:predicted GNAT superfamily acetyltransferase
MDRIVVSDDYQNMKIGTKLYAHLEKEMRREKIPILCCEVNVVPPNVGSTRFHQRLGFKVVKRHEHEPGYVVDMMMKEVIAGTAAKP